MLPFRGGGVPSLRKIGAYSAFNAKADEKSVSYTHLDVYKRQGLVHVDYRAWVPVEVASEFPHKWSNLRSSELRVHPNTLSSFLLCPFLL